MFDRPDIVKWSWALLLLLMRPWSENAGECYRLVVPVPRRKMQRSLAHSGHRRHPNMPNSLLRFHDFAGDKSRQGHAGTRGWQNE